MGQLGFKRKRPLFGKTQYYDFVLRISTRLEQTEEEIIDTLLHEMIHLYIASHQLKDSSSHGPVFRKMMNDLNQRFGRHITISHRKTKDELNQDTQRRQHLVCVSTLASGERGITIAAKSRLLQLWDQIPRIPEIVSQTWYRAARSSSLLALNYIVPTLGMKCSQPGNKVFPLGGKKKMARNLLDTCRNG